MGYYGKLEEKRLAISLRKKGLSYNEIRQKVSVSKSTLSLWCRNVSLSPEQIEQLKHKKLKGAERGRLIGAKRQKDARIARTLKLYQLGKKEVGRINKRDFFVAGIGLYAGDGQKGDKTVGFSNSNPKMIKFMANWFRTFCDIPANRMTGQIWIHDNLNETEARKYWSKISKIPVNRFHKSYISKNKPNSKKIRKNIHKYGVCTVNITSAEVQRKILGWVGGLLVN